MADIAIALSVDADNPDVGDILLDNGTMRLTATLAEEVAQELHIRFRFFKGEWFLDTAQGVPWLQTILGQKTPTGIVAQILRRIVTSCPGVASLESFTMTRPNLARAVTCEFTCTLTDGTILNSADFAPFTVGA